MMWKEKIINFVEIAFVAFVSYAISSAIFIKIGIVEYEKAYAPALPVQTDRFFEDITA